MCRWLAYGAFVLLGLSCAGSNDAEERLVGGQAAVVADQASGECVSTGIRVIEVPDVVGLPLTAASSQETVLSMYQPATPVGGDERQAFCAISDAIEDVYANNVAEQALSAEDSALVKELVDELAGLVPEDFQDEFQLRYWPYTNVYGLDTSGNAAHRAFNRIAALYESSCQP